MSSHSLPKIDQKEYLKKYLSGDKGKKKKKDKKRKKSSAASVKIIDDDINYLNNGPEIDEELLLTGDDAPQIVGEYIQDSPDGKKVPKWKSIVIKDEPEDEGDAIKESETNPWGRKTDSTRVKREFCTDKVRSERISNYSPSRKKDRRRESSDTSPPRSSRKTSPAAQYKRDRSPLRYRTNKQSPDRGIKIKIEPKSPSHRENKASRRNSDQSPPRRRKSPLNSNQGVSPASNTKHSDGSSIRRSKISDQSPPRRNRKDSDQSPPRRHKSSGNYSPQRNNRLRIETPDNSPPRKRRNTPDQSPPRRRNNSEESIPGKSRKYNSNHRKCRPEQSPPRKSRNYEESRNGKRTPDQSPRRRRKSLSPSHKRRDKQTPDLSPPKRRSRWEKGEHDKDLSPPPTHKPKPGKTLEGKKSGLQDAKALQKESLERRKHDDILFETMSSELSGRNAEVQTRSTGRRGRRARAADEEDPEERRRKEDREEKKKLQYDRWGKGLKQIEDHKNRMLEQQYESSKPLARYSNDEDLERHLKEQERAEDPMLEYMRKKRQEKEKQSGKPQIPRYQGAYPENRFGIRPGYRWDGVDRSNGYEKKYFAVQNEKVARQDEAYKYSVEDM